MSELGYALAFAAIIFVLFLIFEYWYIIIPVVAGIIVFLVIFNIHSKKSEEKYKQERLRAPEVIDEINSKKLQILCYYCFFCSYEPYCYLWYENNKYRDKLVCWEMQFRKNDNWRSQLNYYETVCSYNEESKKHYIEEMFGGTNYEWIDKHISLDINKVEYDKYHVKVFFLSRINLDSEYDRDLVIDALNQYFREEIRSLSDYSKEFEKLHSLVFKSSESSQSTDARGLSASAPAHSQASTSNSAKPANKTTSTPDSTAAPIKSASQPIKCVTPTIAFLGQIQLPTNKEITIGLNGCDIKGGYASKHAKIKKEGNDWKISNVSLESRKSEEVTLLVNGKEIGTSYITLKNGDKITFVGVYNKTEYIFTIK